MKMNTKTKDIGKKLLAWLLSCVVILSMIPPIPAKAETEVLNITGFAKAKVTITGKVYVERFVYLRYDDFVESGNPPRPGVDLVSVSKDKPMLTSAMSVAIQPGIYSDQATTTKVSEYTGTNTVTLANATSLTTYWENGDAFDPEGSGNSGPFGFITETHQDTPEPARTITGYTDGGTATAKISVTVPTIGTFGSETVSSTAAPFDWSYYWD